MIETVHLFAPMRGELIAILKGLSPEQWNLPTACEGWSVKDVALHLLADDISVLSRQRDGFSQRDSFADWEDLVAWINTRNEAWVSVAGRMSPRVLCELLGFTGAMMDEFLRSWNMTEIAGAVSWAGDKPAPRWLDAAREYTEYWMHHQHICEALGMESLKTHEYFHPLMDTFLQALPHTYRNTTAAPNAVLEIHITGAVDARWFLVFESGTWALHKKTDLPSTCTITCFPELAWKIFTKGIDSELARSQAIIRGEADLATPFFQMVSIIA